MRFALQVVFCTFAFWLSGSSPSFAQGKNIAAGKPVAVVQGKVSGAPLSTLTDGKFRPSGAGWQDGTIWWQGPGTVLEVDLQGEFLIHRLTLQADNNDVYRITYHDPVKDAWFIAWDAPSIPFGGMRTRPNMRDDRDSHSLTQPVTADRLRIQAMNGDVSFSLSELQVFDTPVVDLASIVKEAFPPLISTGDTLTTSWVVRAVGGLDAADAWEDGVVLSRNEFVGDADDRILATVPRPGPLPAGGEYVQTVTFTVPSDLESGLYFLFRVADVTDAVKEGDEFNNWGWVDPLNIIGRPVAMAFIGRHAGHDYYRTIPSTTPPAARATGAAVGGYCVSINDAEEQAFLDAYTFKLPWFHMGLSDEEKEGQFRWQSGEPLTFVNWAPGEPNNAGGNEDFGVLNWGAERGWNDVTPVATASAIIEVPTTRTWTASYVGSWNGHDYFLTDEPTHYLGARFIAGEMGGHLVAITDPGEQDWITSRVGDMGLLFIGLNDKPEEGVFRWDSGEPLEFTMWAPGEPNGSGDWGVINHAGPGRWGDVADDFALRGIVEVAAPPPANFTPGHVFVFDGVWQDSDILEYDSDWSLVRSFRASLPPGGRLGGAGYLRWGPDGYLYCYGDLYVPATGWRIGVMQWRGDGTLYAFYPRSDTSSSAAGFEIASNGDFLTTEAVPADQDRVRRWSRDFASYQALEVTQPMCPGDEGMVRIGETLYIATNHCVAVYDLEAGRQTGYFLTQHDNNRIAASRRGLLSLNRQWYGPPFKEPAFVEAYDERGRRVGTATAPSTGSYTIGMAFDDADRLFVASGYLDAEDRYVSQILVFDSTFRHEKTVAPAGARGQFVTIAVAPGEAPTPAPDLRVMHISGAGSVEAGGQLPIVWRVENHGYALAEGTWADAVYLSTDGVLSKDDRLLATRGAGGSELPTNDSYDGGVSALVPTDVAPGVYRLIVLADAQDVLGDPTPLDRIGVSEPIEVMPPGTSVVLTPAEDGGVHRDPGGVTVVGVKGQWWPVLGMIPSPPQEDQWIAEFDLSALRGQTFASARIGFFAWWTRGYDRLSFGVHAYEGNGVVDIGDFDAGEIKAGALTIEAPVVGAAITPLERFVEVDVTEFINARAGDFIGFNLRLAGDPPDFAPNVFNVAEPFRWTYVGASENGTFGGIVRPYLKLAPKSGQGGPDLAVGAVGITSPPVFGAPLRVEWSVRNAGSEAASGAWVDRVYLSTDAAWDASDLPLEPSVVRPDPNTPLAPKWSYSQAAEVMLPVDYSGGEFYVLVRADDAGAVNEADESNNVGVSKRIKVGATPRPDLVVTNVTPPVHAPPGSMAQVTYVVRNAGEGAALGSWEETVYASPDGSIGDDQVAGSGRFNGPLLPGESRQRVMNVRIPDLPPGDYWIVVCVDTSGEAPESDESNNCTIVPVCVHCDVPNLEVASVAVDPTGVAGQPIGVEWVVRNIGGADAVGSWVDRVLLSPTQNQADGVVVAELRRSGGLPAGEEYRITRSVVVPVETEGARYAIVVTDSYNELAEPSGEHDNWRASENPAQISLPPGPDLVVAAVEPASSSGTFDRPFELTWRVRNEGNAPAEGAWTDRVFLSRDPVRGSDDYPLEPARPATNTPLAPGAEYDAVHTVNLPLLSSLGSGTYYFIVATDAGGAVQEQRESNQWRASGPVQIDRPPLPDLRVMSISVPPEAAPGERVTATYTVVNAGTEVATGPWTERLLTSPDDVIGNDYFGSEQQVEETLLPGQSVTREGSVVVPSEGLSYRVVACLDVRGEVFELDETNNCALSEMRAPIARADIAPIAIGSPQSSVLADDMLTVTYVARNLGSAGTLSSFIDTVWLVSDDPKQAAYLLGSVPHGSMIPAGEGDPVSAMFLVPGRLLGNFRIRVRTDAANNLLEPNEENNVAESVQVIEVGQPPRPDLMVLMGSVIQPADGPVATRGSVSWVLMNMSDVPVQGAWIDRIVARPIGAPGPDVQIGTLSHADGFPARGVEMFHAEVTLPSLAGDYQVCIITDSGDVINEGRSGGEENNEQCSFGTFRAEGYRVTVVPSRDEGLAGDAVTISGVAESLLTGLPLPNVPVRVNVAVRGFNRVVSATTDEKGLYGEDPDQPVRLPLLPVEAGRYTLTAGPPGAIAPEPAAQFVLHGLRATPRYSGLRVAPGVKAATAQLELFNAGDLTLTGLHAQIVNPPPGLDVELRLNDESIEGQSIPGQTVVRPRLTLSAPPGTENFTGEFSINWSTKEGASATTVLEVRVAPRDAQLSFSTSELRAGMLTNRPPDDPQQTTVQFTITNDGGEDTGSIRVLLPDGVAWMTLSTPTEMPSLAPDESAEVVLTLTPGKEVPYAEHTGGIAFHFPNGRRSALITYRFRHLPSGVGALTVNASDEETYFAPGKPPLAGAQVTVREAYTNQIYATQATGPDGTVTFEDLPEGTYYTEVSKERHLAYRNLVNVRRAATTTDDAFLPIQAVTYTWTVDPIQIEDRYRFVLNAEFVSTVYAPALDIKVIDPETGEESRVIDFDDIVTEKQLIIRVENVGLAAAEEVQIQISDAPAWEIVSLVDRIAPLEPGAAHAVHLPVTVRPVGRGLNRCILPLLSLVSRITCADLARYTRYGVISRLSGSCQGQGTGYMPSSQGSSDPPGSSSNPYVRNPNPPPTPTPPCSCKKVAIIFFTGYAPFRDVFGFLPYRNPSFRGIAAGLVADHPDDVIATVVPQTCCASDGIQIANDWLASMTLPNCPPPRVILVGHSLGGDTVEAAVGIPNVFYAITIDPINRHAAAPFMLSCSSPCPDSPSYPCFAFDEDEWDHVQSIQGLVDFGNQNLDQRSCEIVPRITVNENYYSTAPYCADALMIDEYCVTVFGRRVCVPVPRPLFVCLRFNGHRVRGAINVPELNETHTSIVETGGWSRSLQNAVQQALR